MRMYDLLVKKRDGKTLTSAEIEWMIEAYTKGEIPDYQMSAMLMAIFIKGLNNEETSILTLAMAKSGDLLDLSEIAGIKVDKHSTGGVGDKTTLIIGPIVAACGVPVAKMSGRGLGHTGGTVDKLESIPGFETALEPANFINIVQKIGIAVAGQSGNLAPADKKLYALRDVTGTVDNISLIAASVMSKKIAAGADCILLDVKTGSGAFMKTDEDAKKLADTMVEIGELVGRKTTALVTDMSSPLGYAIGNSLEIIEVIDVLRGVGPKDLTEVCFILAENMLYLAQKGTPEECRKMAEEAVASGKAYQTFIAMVEAQQGDSSVIKDPAKFTKAKYTREVKAAQAGYVEKIDAEKCGIASMLLGAGRRTKEDKINYAAGIVLAKKLGDYVNVGDTLATLYADDEALFEASEKTFLQSYSLSSAKPELPPLVHMVVKK